MKVLMLRPPLYIWPYVDSAGDCAVTPQAYLYLTASLLDNKIAEVKILDCVAEHIGWKSLKEILDKEKSHVICLSVHETSNIYEMAYAAKLAKMINKNIIVIVGGYHVSAMPEESLLNYPFDIIVRFEGELTLMELIKELNKETPELRKVRGIVFKENGSIIFTPLRDLIQNLDDLPDLGKAYKLSYMKNYKKGYFWDGVVISASRGCIGNCTFCICWQHMGEHVEKNGELEVYPRFRQRSVKSVIREIEMHYYKYNHRGCYLFADDTFNVNPQWTEEFSQSILERNLKISFGAFMRADFILRDEKLGVFEKLVKTGLAQAIIGVERASDSELEELNKSECSKEVTKEAFRLLKKKYPSVVRQASIIVGMENETRTSMRKLARYVLKELDVDSLFMSPLFPAPKSIIWQELKEKGYLNNLSYSEYNSLYPLLPSKYLTRQQIFEEMFKIRARQLFRINHILKAIWFPWPTQRALHRFSYYKAFKYLLKSLCYLKNPLRIQKKDFDMAKPSWYYS